VRSSEWCSWPQSIPRGLSRLLFNHYADKLPLRVVLKGRLGRCPVEAFAPEEHLKDPGAGAGAVRTSTNHEYPLRAAVVYGVIALGRGYGRRIVS